MLSLIQHEVVDVHNDFDKRFYRYCRHFTNHTRPIAFNSATYIGYTAVTDMGFTTFQGVIGSAICTLAVSIPSLVIMTIVCAFFARLNNNPWMRAALSVLKIAIIGLIAAAALMLMDRNNFIDYKSLIIFALVLVASIKKVDPILLIILSGVAGLILY